MTFAAGVDCAVIEAAAKQLAKVEVNIPLETGLSEIGVTGISEGIIVIFVEFIGKFVEFDEFVELIGKEKLLVFKGGRIIGRH